ncbi:hypothetical protein HPB51_028139 [Rhipicephalus microplus]|uniref:Uncharacterized protein n=1 Tax=Rhipicephalus microplus TaxID=6941 RepID=A0A9J6CYE1_RHIMP|nr:hypothetical protein HPB51_028139 [Rhipicephalus microplus]
MRSDVFRTLVTSMRPAVVYPSPVTVTDIEVHTAPLRSKKWLRAFRQNMLAPEVQHSDEVYLSNVEFFFTMAGVMTSYQDVELLSFVLLVFRAPLVLRTRSSVSLFARAERAAVSCRFYLLVSAAIDMVNSSEWLDAEVLAARVPMAENSLSTHLHLWPPKKCLEEDVFRHMYDAFPSTESSFTKYWVSSPLAVRLRHTARAPTSSF